MYASFLSQCCHLLLYWKVSEAKFCVIITGITITPQVALANRRGMYKSSKTMLAVNVQISVHDCTYFSFGTCCRKKCVFLQYMYGRNHIFQHKYLQHAWMNPAVHGEVRYLYSHVMKLQLHLEKTTERCNCAALSLFPHSPSADWIALLCD